MNTNLLEQAGFTLPLPADAYIDTIKVLLPGRDMAKFREMVPALGQQASFRASKIKGYKRLEIQLPKIKLPQNLLQQLADYQAHSRLILSRVDVACDVACENTTSAAWVMEWFSPRYRQRWPGSRSPKQYLDTIYTSNKFWNDKSLVMYSDKLSKVTKKPCAHFELRMKGACKVLACKIDSLKTLAGLDLAEFMYRQLHFEEINFEALGRIIRKRSKAKKPDIEVIRLRDGRAVCTINRDLRAGYLIARGCSYSHLSNATQSVWRDLEFAPNDIPAMLLRERLKKDWPGLRVDCVFERIDARKIFNIRPSKKRRMVYV